MSDPILRICKSGVSNSQNLLSRPFPLIPGTQGDSVRLSEVRKIIKSAQLWLKQCISLLSELVKYCPKLKNVPIKQK